MLFIHHMENLLDRSSNYKDPLFRWKLSQVSSHFQNSPPVENMLILRMENRSGMQRVLKVREKSHLVFFHGLNESLDLCRKLSETEKRCRKILGRLNSFTQQEEQRKKNAYEVFAPATAMLKPFCSCPSPLEKPCRSGLNFFKMSGKTQ